ncbi:MAG: heme ABC exporter ATP-binding protein CcmA [Candidatus Tectomicrobia bacterium]|uniref:Heme ABC exporter ATP-binding protein CcmA n=1 Tax=Tectimicrobiota bacterium TaxID=2528274 RepID=A0A932M222_UNCTE|nr:heme ABC exporter ATP-binding protein CcmA [Candidatus Tectomicrobia bacterium]
MEKGQQPEPLVRIEGLTRSYGYRKVLRGVNLELGAGEILTIFGPNGAGKSTLIRVLSTSLRPEEGTIRIAGHDLRKEGEDLRRKIGVVAHRSFLYGSLTARENLHFYASLYGCSGGRDPIEKLLAMVGLEERKDDPVRTFSRGMEQRLAIARAILHDPKVLLLDEPYTGLDQHAVRILNTALLDVRRQGKGIILTTHDLGRGLEISDWVAILVAGKIVYQERAARIGLQDLEAVYYEHVGERVGWGT